MKDKFLETIMDPICVRTLTICGSMRCFSLIQKYQAYYTLKCNIVFAPINYYTIRSEVETNKLIASTNKNILSRVHERKIHSSDAIIVVIGEDDYVSNDTLNEIKFARARDKRILFTKVPEEDRDKYYFNHDLTYPLYILKED